MHPHRPRLAVVLAEEIRRGIRAGRWAGWLPEERTLAEELRASRSTLRQALAGLRKEGMVEALHGVGSRIVAEPVHKPGPPRRDFGPVVVLLTPGRIEEVRPVTTLPFDFFRQQLIEAGCQIRVVESRAAYGRHPERALAKLVDHHAADGWVLRLSSLPMQRWFQQRGLPAVVLGSCQEGIDLPFVDIDRYALCRHAANTLIAAGHRHVALLTSEESRGGDLRGRAGFEEAAARAAGAHPDLRAEVLLHNDSVAGVVRQVSRLLARKPRPTALLISQPSHYATVVSELARHRLRVPDDLSLITEAGGPILSYFVPKPASYHVSQRVFARRLLGVVLGVARREGEISRANWIAPRYVPGGSLAPVA